MGGINSHSGGHFECCACGRSVNTISDLRAKSPGDASFLQQFGRYQDSRYYASSRVLTNVGFCSSKCFSRKLVPQTMGHIDVSTIAHRINSEAKTKLSETLLLDIESLTWDFVEANSLKTCLTNLREDAQSLRIDPFILAQSIGRGHGKTGILYWKKFPLRFHGHTIGACSFGLDDGGARNCAITVVVYFVADTIEFTKRQDVADFEDSGSISDHDPFDALLL